MGAALYAIAGPLKGQVFPVDERPLGIGRDTANRIAVGDVSVSRRHSLIRQESEGGFHIADLESLNGTFVNNVPVHDRLLRDGDRIQIGSSLFLFALAAESAQVLSPAAEMPGRSRCASTVAIAALPPDEALLLASGRAASSALASALAKGLDGLLTATRALHSVRRLNDWCECLLDQAFALAPLTRAALVLTDEAGELAEGISRERGDSTSRAVEIDADVAREALKSGRAILRGEPQATGVTRVAFVTAPVVAAGQPRGVLQCEAAGELDEPQAHLLAALASVAAGALENVRHLEWLEGERQRLESEFQVEHEMVGESAALKRVIELVGKVAPSDATVLLLGESGTGKELMARAIHRNSPRAGRPFVAVNCAALSEALLESDLFGYERGAFTGAVQRKPGRIEVAEGGTLFLDEVGELALSLQAKLLRAVETKEFERVGGTRPLKVDVRIVAATNRDLDQAVREGSFRRDLFHRLNVMSLTMPALRERRDDIHLLASYFAQRAARRGSRKLVGISPEARRLLVRYDWPGNVRELQNAIERALLLGDGELVRPEDLPEALVEGGAGEASPPSRYHEAVAAAKRRLIQGAVAEAHGNVSEAARLLGLHPNYLHRLMKNLGLKGGGER